MSNKPETLQVHIGLQPGHAIRRLHQIAVGIFLQETQAHGITPVQYAALQVVHDQPGIDQRTLARNIAQDTSTTAGVVERLEGRGWLARQTAPHDRRARVLTLTAAGEKLLADTVPGMLQAQERILGPLSAADRQEFMRMLQLLVTENNELSRAPGDVGR